MVEDAENESNYWFYTWRVKKEIRNINGDCDQIYNVFPFFWQETVITINVVKMSISIWSTKRREEWCKCLSLQDPLFRFFEREVKSGAKLLQDIRQDLVDVVQVCEGKKKQTNYLRTLISEMVKGKEIKLQYIFCKVKW